MAGISKKETIKNHTILWTVKKKTSLAKYINSKLITALCWYRMISMQRKTFVVTGANDSKNDFSYLLIWKF